MDKRVYAHCNAIRVSVDQQIKVVLCRYLLTECVHFLELPRCVDMEERKRNPARSEGFLRKVKEDTAVFTDGIKHHRLFKFSGDLPHDVNGFRLQLLYMRTHFRHPLL